MRFAFISRCTLLILLAATAAHALAGDRPTNRRQDASTASTANPASLPASKELSAPPPRPTRAIGRLVCTDRTYKISTGTDGGSCLSGVSEGECKDGGNSASVSCKSGCGTTTGKGTCTTE